MNGKTLIAILATLLLVGCANVTKVAPGDTVVADRVGLTLSNAWNEVKVPGNQNGSVIWTQDGITLDLLQFYVGIKDGQSVGPPARKDQRPLVFNAHMAPHEVVGLFEGIHSRDGSSFTLDKLEPADFLGGKGFRFEFSVVRKVDDVRLTGVAWGVVRRGELFVMSFTAPRAGWFPRLQPQVEQIAKSARPKI